MNPELQTILALLVVMITAGIFIWKRIASPGKKGCAGGCGCNTKPVIKTIPR